jgi:type I restriction enzyme S subunit
MSATDHTHREGRQLPAGWRLVSLGDCGEVVSGVTVGRRVEGQGIRDVPYLRVANVKDGHLDLADVTATAASADEIAALALRQGDLLLTEGGDPDKLGRGTVWEGQLPECIHQNHVFRVRFDAQGFEPAFVAFQAASPYGKAYFLHHAKQTTGIATINQRVLKAFPLMVPPLPEQQRIAAVLREQMAAVEKARAAAQARLAAVKDLPAAFLRQVFGDSPAFAASPVTPTKPVHPGWTWHRLIDIARLATGHTPSRYHPEYWKGTIPWLQLADIRALDGHEAQDTSEHANELGIENSSAVLLPAGTVCMSRTASVGFFAVMGRPMATSQDFVNWVCGDALDPWFLMYLQIANRKRIRDLGSGAVHQTIYFPTVQAFSVCVPSIAEQRRLAGVLREQVGAAESACAAAEEGLDTINALPAALLRRAFAGEL